MGQTSEPENDLGTRLKQARLESGSSLRELARRLEVSPSFISQLENGKSQPSVATLLSLTQVLGISMDALFPSFDDIVEETDNHVRSEPSDGSPQDSVVRRTANGSPSRTWEREPDIRFAIIDPSQRARLEMDSGVVWEQLAPSVDHSVDFIEVVYPVGSSSTNDGRMLRHSGLEFGLLLQGEVMVTYGFKQFTLRAGQSITLDPSVPHLLTNIGDIEARGVWCLIHAKGPDH